MNPSYIKVTFSQLSFPLSWKAVLGDEFTYGCLNGEFQIGSKNMIIQTIVFLYQNDWEWWEEEDKHMAALIKA